MHSELIVAKFGGSSMADNQAITRSAKVALNHQANIVLVSATSGTTNDLIELAQTSQNKNWEDCLNLLEKISARHRNLAHEMQVDDQTMESLEALILELETLSKGINLLRDCTPKAMDSILSIGERLSSHLMTTALAKIHNNKTVKWIDARKLIKTDDQYGRAIPNIEKIRAACQKELIDAKYGDVVFVTQGFIGSTDEEITTTLGRGGSDFSAALLAEGIGADILQIWTDVAGIATTDPRIVKQARPIEKITFKEAAELASFGGKVLHPSTLTPARRSDIKVFVGSSFDANQKGTWIEKTANNTPLVRALAVKRNQCLVTVATPKMSHTHGFLAAIFNIFDRHKVSIDSITTSEISVAFTLDDRSYLSKAVVQELEDIAEIKIEEGLALVSLIGNNINYTPGLAKDIFGALETGGPINVRMICQGASKHNFCFLVNESLASEALIRLHHKFLEGQGAAVSAHV